MANNRISKIAKISEMGNKLCNYYDFISWARWYPDLLLDIMKPERGGINLSLDQRIFMRCDVRFFSMYGDFSRGYAKCIAGDSLIYTDKGVKEIGEFFNYQNDGIETHYNTTENVVNRYGTLEKTRLGLYNGKQKCKKITTSEGYSLTGTHIHRVLCMKPDGNIDWVMTKDIKVGDCVVINRKNDVWGTDDLSVDEAMALGYLTVCGSMSPNGDIVLNTRNKSIIRNYKRIMNNMGADVSLVGNSCVVKNENLYRRFNEFGVDFQNSIPKKIMSCSKNTVTAFLDGVFETCVHNGAVIVKSSKLAHQIQTIILNFGTISSIITAKDNNNQNCYFIKGLDEIDDSDYYYARVKSIEDVVTDVYDFHLPETHSFVSNGFVSHNTYTEVLDCIVTAMLFPNVTLAISAQTKENAADLLSAKWNEITKHFPLILNEVDGKPKFSKGTSWIRFKNGSEIDAIANSQSTKGQRRTRIKIEESALLNNALFEDALAPVVEVPRLTVGKLGMVDPCELNQQIHFFTTAGFKGSDEHSRLITMIDDMENLKGKIVLGSNWMLPCWYGRGSSKSQILQKKKDMSVVSFAQNYEQEWVGASEGALVNINKLLDCRTMPNLTLKPKEDEEYYLGMDVARSQKSSNNQSSIVVGRIKRNANRTKILSADIVNIINIPNILNFNAQAAKIKRVQKQYNAKAVIIDGNGLGAGLVDALLTETICPITGESLGCWDTMNDTNVCEVPNSPKIVYNLKAQSCQNEIITTFIDYVESKRLRLYERKIDNTFTEKEWDDFDNAIRPYMETDAFIEEAANLRMKHLPSGSITIERVVKKIDKDRVSALIYMLWYVEKFARDVSINTEYESHVFVN